MKVVIKSVICGVLANAPITICLSSPGNSCSIGKKESNGAIEATEPGEFIKSRIENELEPDDGPMKKFINFFKT